MIEVDAILFRAVSECRSYEETRWYLNGVYVQPHPDGGALLVATDGHRLLCAYDRAAKVKQPRIVHVEPKAIDAKALVAISKAMPGERAKLTVDDAGILTLGTYRSLRTSFVDGTFPNWLAVVRPILEGAASGKLAVAAFNHRYLTSFGRIREILKGKDDAGAMKVIAFDEGGPALVLFPSLDDVFGIIMPMRAGLEANAIPAFMAPIMKPAAKPATAPTPSPDVVEPQPRRKAARRKPANRRTKAKKAAKSIVSLKGSRKRRAA